MSVIGLSNYAPPWLHSLLMVFLYFTQGVAQGVSMTSGTYFLTKFPNDVSTATVATLSLPVYAFSIKWLWSPIIDGIFIGMPKYRRLCWILPAQLLMAVIFGAFTQYLPSGGDAEFISNFKDLDSEAKESFFWMLSGIFFLLAAAAAIQDVAVDGWAIEGLPSHKVALASSTQTVGLISGGTTTVLFLLLSPKYPETITLYGYMLVAAIVSFSAIPLCLLFVFLFGVPKLPSEEERSLQTTRLHSHYVGLFQLIMSKPFRKMILLFMIIELPWATDSVRNTLLVKEGYFSTDLLVIMDIIERIIEISCASLVSQVIARRGADKVLIASTKIAVVMIVVQVAGYTATMKLMTPTANDTNNNESGGDDGFSGGIVHWVLSTLQISSWPVGWFAIIWLPQALFAMLVHSFDFTAGSTLKVTLASQQKALAGSAITVLNAFANFGKKWPTTVALYLHKPLLDLFKEQQTDNNRTTTLGVEQGEEGFGGLVKSLLRPMVELFLSSLSWGQSAITSAFSLSTETSPQVYSLIEETCELLRTDPVYLMLICSLILGIAALQFIAYPLIRGFRPLILQSMKAAWSKSD